MTRRRSRALLAGVLLLFASVCVGAVEPSRPVAIIPIPIGAAPPPASQHAAAHLAAALASTTDVLYSSERTHWYLEELLSEANAAGARLVVVVRGQPELPASCLVAAPSPPPDQRDGPVNVMEQVRREVQQSRLAESRALATLVRARDECNHDVLPTAAERYLLERALSPAVLFVSSFTEPNSPAGVSAVAGAIGEWLQRAER